MMYWTLLVITILSGPLDGQMTYLVYEGKDACNAARRTVSDTLHYDHKIDCIESDTPVEDVD